jgi:hypothetical protein
VQGGGLKRREDVEQAPCRADVALGEAMLGDVCGSGRVGLDHEALDRGADRGRFRAQTHDEMRLSGIDPSERTGAPVVVEVVNHGHEG